MPGGIVLTNKTKKIAYDKRDEDLKKLRAKISDKEISNQVCEFYHNGVYMIIAETEEEVKKFFINLGIASLCFIISIGAVAAAVITPPAILISPAAATMGATALLSATKAVKKGIDVTNLQKFSGDEAQENLDLKIYDGCKIDVELCFGKVSFTLKSKIKLSH